MLRNHGLIDLLEIDVIDSGDAPVRQFRPDAGHRRSQNIETVAEVAAEVRDAVAQALVDGDVPVVIGGDCTITLGVVAGITAIVPDATLAYFDGDVDMSTPETTRSGILDAMGVAHLLNVPGADARLADLGPRIPMIDGERLALIGFEAEDVTPEDAELLEQCGVGRFPASDLRADLANTLIRIEEFLGDSPRIVHFDVDAVDSTEMPLAEYPHFNSGVGVEAAQRILGHLCATPRLAGLVVTEANPRRDPDQIYVPLLARMVAGALNRYAKVAG